MTTIFARKALLARGWEQNVRIRTRGGRIAGLERDAAAEPGDVAAGIVIPGLANAHSHAFQRALAGHTEYRGPADKDNFWTWRELMYRLAGQIDAEALADIARQVYTEMVASGYTSVVEFHYLHRQPGESTPSTAMLESLVAAADDSGIRLTYVPVLYERGGFDDTPLSAEQQRFALPFDAFVRHYEQAKSTLSGRHAVGIGAHSLRAVSAASLHRIADIADADKVPMHIHIAEQQREVDDCLAVYHARPVYWLLDNFDVNSRWCLVHATHMDAEEVARMARSGAVAGLCPSTEGNLGDGIFRLQSYLENEGHIAIGSDSHVSINPFEELRWLEYGQRLIEQKRNVAAIRTRSTGRSLFERAAIGGAMAAGGAGGRLEKGAPADLLVLDDDSPMLAGHGTDSILDALVFSGFTLPLDRVMVDGEWRVIDGLHPGARAAFGRYSRRIVGLHAGGPAAR